MKRRRINLLSLNLKKFDLETAAKKVQFWMIGILVFLIVCLISTAFINNYLSTESAELENAKRPLTQYFETNSDFDSKIKFLIYKNNLLKEYTKEDARAYTYYRNLIDHIASVTTAAQISTFTVDNVGQTQFEVVFPSYDVAQTFLEALEKPEFIKPFEYLKLSGFEVSGSKNESFSLGIEGKFLKE